MITQVFVVFNMCLISPSNLVFFLGGYWKAADLTIDYRPSGTYAKHALHDSHDRPNFFGGEIVDIHSPTFTSCFSKCLRNCRVSTGPVTRFLVDSGRRTTVSASNIIFMVRFVFFELVLHHYRCFSDSGLAKTV